MEHISRDDRDEQKFRALDERLPVIWFTSRIKESKIVKKIAEI